MRSVYQNVKYFLESFIFCDGIPQRRRSHVSHSAIGKVSARLTIKIFQVVKDKIILTPDVYDHKIFLDLKRSVRGSTRLRLCVPSSFFTAKALFTGEMLKTVSGLKSCRK